jgi:hypothetical protein
VGGKVFAPHGWSECIADYNSRVDVGKRLTEPYHLLGITHRKTEKLRKLLLKPVYDKARAGWRAAMSEKRQLQLEAQSLSGANMWMECGPMADELCVEQLQNRTDNLPPKVWRALFQWHALGKARFALPKGQEKETEQECGRVGKNRSICKDKITNDLDHACDNCICIRNEKHQAAAGAIVVLAQRAGFSATMKGTIAGSELRGDITIQGMEMRPVMLDFSSVTPLNTTVYKKEKTGKRGQKLPKGYFDILKHMRVAQEKKKAKYELLCDSVTRS